MMTLKGSAAKIKVLNLSEHPLVRFNCDHVNCLIVSHSLDFLFEVNEGDELVLGGYYNRKKQFVVKKFCVLATFLAK